MAFLHLGIIYAQGVGTEQNDILASYFIKKAIIMWSRKISSPWTRCGCIPTSE